MQGSGENGSFKARGSFGIPEGAMKQMEEARRKAHAAQEPAAEVEPEIAAEEPAAPTGKLQTLDDKEKLQRAEWKRLKEFYEKELETKVTEDDVRDEIFRGRMIKTNVVIIPGYLSGTFYTLTTQDCRDVDAKVAEFMKDGKSTSAGVDNEKAIRSLTYAWREAQPLKGGKPDGAARPLGDTIEDREKTISAMAASVVNAASAAFNNLRYLQDYAQREKGLLKKS